MSSTIENPNRFCQGFSCFLWFLRQNPARNKVARQSSAEPFIFQQLSWILPVLDFDPLIYPLQIQNVLDEALHAGRAVLFLMRSVCPKLLLTAALLGPNYKEKAEDLAHAAAILEMIHMASLIHDDIIDDSALRRGKATVQAKFGKDVAVYTGDFLLVRVLRLSVKETFYSLQHHYADAIERLCLGEIGQDLNRYNADLTVEQYMEHIRGKTAALFMIACGAGAEIAGCSPETVAAMERIGENLGILFQLRDDLLDFTAGEEALGKPAGIDFVEGIYTMPVLYALQAPETRRRLRSLMARSAAGVAGGALIGETAELVAISGALDKTRRLMGTYEQEIRELARDLPETEAREMLLNLVGDLTHA